jgi:hypothetical protein
MGLLSNKLHKWVNPQNGDEGLSYYCQGCENNHTIKTTGAGAWGWNGDVDMPVFTPSVLVTYPAVPDAEEEFKERRAERRCHTFVGCNGAKPGEVIFLSDCTHALAGQVHPMPDLPDWML